MHKILVKNEDGLTNMKCKFKVSGKKIHLVMDSEKLDYKQRCIAVVHWTLRVMRCSIQ